MGLDRGTIPAQVCGRGRDPAPERVGAATPYVSLHKKWRRKLFAMATAQYQRTYRKRRKANGGARLTVSAEDRAGSLAVLSPPPPAADPIEALAKWTEARLKVPAGHPQSGRRLALPSYFLDFLRDAMAPGVREAGVFVARKNAKSACVAALILAHVAEDGPLRRLGWRCGAASVNADKAVELWRQCEDIAAASGLTGIKFGRVPRTIVSEWGRVDFLSSDKASGHASGFDLAIADELGLFPERGRDLVSGLISSTSARDGRLLAISILGGSPLTAEMVARADDPATVVHVHQAPAGCDLDDEAAWRAANPTLGSIKSLSYMEDMARRAVASPAEQSAFRAFDLNLPSEPGREMIVDVQSWELVATQPRPERSGPFFVGLDAGGSASMTAAAIFWPEVGRLECYGGYGDVAVPSRPRTVGRGRRAVSADVRTGRIADLAGQGYAGLRLHRVDCRIAGRRTTDNLALSRPIPPRRVPRTR